MLTQRCSPQIWAAIALVFDGDLGKASTFVGEARAEEIKRMYYGRHKLLREMSPADVAIEVLGRLGVKLSLYETAQIRQLGDFMDIASCQN